MTIRDDIFTALIAWLQTAPLSLTAQQVIRARQPVDAPKPAKPYLTLLLLTLDIPNGTDWKVSALAGGLPTQRTAGNRSSTLSIQAYGEGAEDWLTTAHMMLDRVGVGDALTTAGLSLDRLGAITDLSAVLDTGYEARYSAEYTLRYGVISATETLTPVESVVTTSTYTSDTSGDLTITDTISTV